MSKALWIALLAVLATTVPAAAKTWVTDYAKSRIAFTGNQGGESFEGGFKKFTTTIDFDPANPETGKITASIDITSVTAGSPDRDAYLPQSDWFDTSKFPKAEFVSTSISTAGCNGSDLNGNCAPPCYHVGGTLTIKGISKQVMLPFCLTPEGDHMRAQGKLTLLRNDFTIGAGQWSGEDVVSNAVTVTVDITAKAN